MLSQLSTGSWKPGRFGAADPQSVCVPRYDMPENVPAVRSSMKSGKEGCCTAVVSNPNRVVCRLCCPVWFAQHVQTPEWLAHEGWSTQFRAQTLTLYTLLMLKVWYVTDYVSRLRFQSIDALGVSMISLLPTGVTVVGLKYHFLRKIASQILTSIFLGNSRLSMLISRTT